MKILFATMAAFSQGATGPTSDLASARYRVLIPALGLARLGHQVQLATVPPQGWPQSAFDSDCDTLVISKSFHAANEELAIAMKQRGKRVVVDFCDDHFAHPEIGRHHRTLVELADQVVAATPAMAEALRGHTGRNAIVVTDPVEGRRGAPRFAPTFPALRLVWFGHPSNLGGIRDKAGELRRLAASMPVRLSVVTSPSPQLPELLRQLNGIDTERLQVSAVPWSPEATWAALDVADIVWIPVEEAASKAVKSANRLVESLWAGRLVVADTIPSYVPFADLTPVGEPLADAVATALSDPRAVETRLREAQRRVAALHSSYGCARAWAQALGDAAEAPLRLNLGCGDKILPGYVNVDVVESRAGMRPDVICDLHELTPFADNSADEILSVHVVEHFWRWEVRDIVLEWVRVLKPGGRMVIECPNLLSACRTFLDDPAQCAREDREGQRTMWVFYGDPAWKDPLMIHRWGYTPESLSALLVEAGLIDVQVEPAQFKLREPRDMRVVGRKP